jgi:hypothetical protein
MSLAMTASSMSALLVLLERQENLRDNLMELKHGIEADRAQKVEVEINYERRKWLDWLSPVKVQRWQDSNIALRQPGTGICKIHTYFAHFRTRQYMFNLHDILE